MRHFLLPLTIVSSVLALSCDPEPVTPSQFPPFVHLTNLPAEKTVVKTVDESVTFEVQVVKPDGSPAAFADYILQWGDRPPETKADQVVTTGPDAIGWTMRSEHIEPNIERLTITSTHRDIPFQPRCQIGRVKSASADDRLNGDYTPCPGLPWVQFWGGRATSLITAQPSLALTVGERRPVLLQALIPGGAGLSHHPVTKTILNTAVATVNASGVVTAHAPGTTSLVAQVDGLSKSISIVVTDIGPPGAPVPSLSRNELNPEARNYDSFHCFEGTGYCTDETSTFMGNGWPEIALGALGGGAVARWTGTGFGAEILAPPWLLTGGMLPITRDERGHFYSEVGRDGFDVLVRSQSPDAGVGEFSDFRFPVSPPVEIMGERLTEREAQPRFVASGFASMNSRRGGGAWVLWVALGEYRDDRLRVGVQSVTETGYCVSTVRLAEILPDGSSRVETVLRERRQYFKTSMTGFETPCQGEGGSEKYPALKPNRLLGQGEETKPTILALGKVLTFKNERWQELGTLGSGLVAHGNTTAPGILLPEPSVYFNGGDPFTALEWTSQQVDAFPRLMSTWGPDEGYVYSAPRVGYFGSAPGPYDRFVAVTAAGFWMLKDGVNAMRFKQLDTFRILEMPRDPPLPGNSFEQGKRVVSANARLRSPIVKTPPVGPLLFGDDRVVYSSASQTYLPIAGAIDGGTPSQISSLPGDVEFINGHYVVVGAHAAQAAGPFTPEAAFSTDGITWTTRTGQMALPWYVEPSKTLSTLESIMLVGPTTPAFNGAWDPATRAPSVMFSANVETAPYAAIDGLSATAMTRGVAVDFTPKSAAVIETDTGEFAVVANFYPTEWPTARTVGRDGLWVRRITRTGVTHDEILVRFPTALLPNVATNNFVDARSAHIIGDTLYGFYVSLSNTNAVYHPITVNLLTEEWQVGPELSSASGYVSKTGSPSSPATSIPESGFDKALDVLPNVALFRPPSGGFLAVTTGHGPEAGGREAVFWATSTDGLTYGPKHFLRPTGGFRQRLSAATLDATGVPLLVIADSMSNPFSTDGRGSAPPHDTLVLRLPWP